MAALGAERVLLVDFQTLEADRDWVAVMVSFAVERYQEEHIPIMENVDCCLEAAQPLMNRPRIGVLLGSWRCLYYAKNQQLAAKLRDPGSWYPTQFDSDASL